MLFQVDPKGSIRIKSSIKIFKQKQETGFSRKCFSEFTQLYLCVGGPGL
jgi:hypothetical protein